MTAFLSPLAVALETAAEAAPGTGAQAMTRDRRMMALDTTEMMVRSRALSTEEVGHAFRLMAVLWSCGGSLVQDDVLLARMLGVRRATFRKLWPVIGCFFVVEDGRLYIDPDVARPGRVEDPEGRPAIPSAVREAVWQRDGERCAYCGACEGPFHLDHIMPWSRGGEHTVENLTVACRSCNLAKRDRTPEEMGWTE